MMKKLNLPFGILLTLILNLVIYSLRFTRVEEVEWNSLVWGVFSCLFCWIIHQLLFLYRTKLGFKVNSIFLSFISIFFVGILIYLFEIIGIIKFPKPVFFGELSEIQRNINSITRCLILSGLYYFIIYHLMILNDKQKNQIEIEKLKQAQLEANLSSLKEQLSPHFLFNTLNTLSSLTNEKMVKEYVDQLANIYRFVLVNKTTDSVSLKDELKFVTSYLHILKMRYENALSVEIKIDKQLYTSRIAPFSLQLLIENAMKHNIASVSKPLNIIIFNINEDFLIVQNNLQEKIDTSNSTGIGLVNIMSRYRYLFQKEVEIQKTDFLFIVKLPIVLA